MKGEAGRGSPGGVAGAGFGGVGWGGFGGLPDSFKGGEGMEPQKHRQWWDHGLDRIIWKTIE